MNDYLLDCGREYDQLKELAELLQKVSCVWPNQKLCVFAALVFEVDERLVKVEHYGVPELLVDWWQQIGLVGFSVQVCLLFSLRLLFDCRDCGRGSFLRRLVYRPLWFAV